MRRGSAFLRRHLPMILAVLALLAVVVVVWIFSAPIASWLRSTWSFDTVTLLREHLLAVAMVGGCLLVLALIWLPKWQAARVQDMKDRLTVENAARQTLAQIVGGAVLLAGLFFTWANLNVAQKNIKITQDTATKNQETATKNQEIIRQGQITDRFTKAIVQLGDEKITVRLGGIYALERIAKESEEDHGPIMEVLTAYVRENAPWPPKPSKDEQALQGEESPQAKRPAPQEQPLPKPAADIQAILTVLGRRTQTTGEGEDQKPRRGEEYSLNLAKTNLGRVKLIRAQLHGADLMETQLQGADLADAQLQGAFLLRAQLQGATLSQAKLQRAQLQQAQLQGAYLQQAQLQGAYLQQAQLQGAHLQGAQLQGAKNLRVEQLATVKTLYQTSLDPPLLEQIQQQYPQLLEKP